MPNEQEREVYYARVTNYARTDNVAARRQWFDATEPREGLPTHGRALATKKYVAIVNLFLARLASDVLRNSIFGWRLGTPLAPVDNPVQPLADDMDEMNQPPSY